MTMDFWQYLNETKSLDLQGISESLASLFSELIARGHSVADLLAHFGEDFGHLPVQRLRLMTQQHRQWLIWRKRRDQLGTTRKQAKLVPFPDEVYASATSPDRLDAIVRTARLCPRQDVEDQKQWTNILTSGVDLWARCMEIALKQGQVHSRAKDLERANRSEVERYDPYVRCSEDLESIAPHRWLAMRRGEREGILELTLDIPKEGLTEQVELFQARLGPGAQERSIDSLLDELILDDMDPWLRRVLDTDAQFKAITAAVDSLTGLLRSAPVQARRVGAIYLIKPRAPVAAVIVDRDGDLLAHKVIKAEGSWLGKIVEFIVGQESLQHVVLPTSAPAGDLLTQLEDRLSASKELGNLQLIKVRTAALSEARRPLTDPPLRLGSSVASAVVLARRAIDPLKEWSLVDPVNIGIAEYQNDLNSDLLRATLTETVELCRLERRRGKRVSMGGGIPRASTAMARLNPLVKNLNDLRPGMTVHGVVTNISHFGAFVNIGLSQEALVHISELSDQFVSNPNDVVSIGQQLTAHVLSVDPGRGRISLSLKSQNKALASRDRGPRRGEKLERNARSAAPMSKSQALASLEKLFKK